MSSLTRPLRWFVKEFGLNSIYQTGRNAYLMILARTCRMFAHGMVTLILAIFFAELKYSDHQIGIFMTLTLLGDVFLGTFLTLIADRVGRRKVLVGGSLLMVSTGVVFAFFENFWILLLAAVVGVISGTGGDFGPFRSIEESSLSQLTTPSTRSDVLAWYITMSTLGSSLGSEASGRIVKFLQNRDGWAPADAYHALFLVYTFMGVVNLILTSLLTKACELRSEEAYSRVPQDQDEPVGSPNYEGGLSESEPERGKLAKIRSWFTSSLAEISESTRAIMYKLWFLLAVDSLADGMVPLSLTNYYMDIKFHPAKSTLGDVTSASLLLGAVGSAFAGPLARRIGLVNTMVFTHVPSSAAVLLFPFPNVFWLTVGLLMTRAGLNNMDQAPRAAFIAAVVKPEERTAVMGITSMLRTLSAMAGPTVTGLLADSKQFWVAFVIAGVCRLSYDFGLYAMFVNTKLYQHENQPANQLNGHLGERHLDEEEILETELEMESLTGSSDSFDNEHNLSIKL